MTMDLRAKPGTATDRTYAPSGRRPARETTIGEWIDRLSQRGGDPGGGAAAGVMLASAAALVAMVASYAEESGVERRARALAQAALDRADADAAAFGAALRAGDDRARDEAALAAARSSAALAALARDAIGDLERIARRVEPTLLADVVSAAAALRAALSCARANLRSDLGALSRHGGSGALRRTHPDLSTAASACDDVIARLDDLTRRIDTRASGAD
ncbi:hypothetical protein ASD19_06055 [Microbacterium sp. Root53]|uniref:cyclodeaminase/cyclohydrolase family protein n=1 Tax=Microbacterium sp. Root53 TaxID=1736553 RepID=UPI0006FC7B68|nr:cyclodeaminase/cyclohydrolase family protein [Microbacterium sp. Root53]KQY98775.1 hypothetical protein ASD19_06055 [Microbacterium sp. Root53]